MQPTQPIQPLHLYIAYKNYSSWSLRPWLALKVAGIEFEETLLPFAHSDSLDQLGARYRIPAQVPVLVVDGQPIWDSLAIMEYAAEQYPDRALWPADKALRALARSAACEMHSSFSALRSACPMNCRSQKAFTPSAAVKADLARIAQIWEHFAAADKPAGEFLCGHFSIVDAMYAPVMWRVLGYGLDVSPGFMRWAAALQALPAMQEWLASAKAEEWVMEKYEAV